ncbi:hypothetical protein COU76_01140 [Candidatus Peregrinibacteria bacterium CG10_big_fil_rev_8_21_14_0_10_49_10]|nr:MAG: hypothetical protein COU76_01140 [Candidatus Peregrinibacteria bacterium CG10_big_fil_rev_8_21_14_0_10_49_10]
MQRLLSKTGVVLSLLVTPLTIGLVHTATIWSNARATLSTTQNTGCFYWRDPCLKQGKWVEKCSLAPRFERVQCNIDECNVGKCTKNGALLTETGTVGIVEEIQLYIPRRLKVEIQKEAPEPDPVLQSGCYFWYDPCPETSKTCTPPPRVIHTTCDDVRCNLGPCGEPEIVSFNENMSEQQEADLVTVDLHDFNGDGMTNIKDKEMQQEIAKDILSKRTVTDTKEKKEEIDSLRKAAPRMREGCFDSKGEWIQEATACAEDQTSFLLQSFEIADSRTGAVIADLENEKKWQKTITATLFQETVSQQQVELTRIMGKGIYRLAMLHERKDLSQTFRKNLEKSMQNVSSLYNSLLTKGQRTEEELQDTSLTMQKEFSFIETLLEDEDRTKRIEKEALQAPAESEGEEGMGVGETDIVPVQEEQTPSTEEVPQPTPHNDILEIVQKTQKLLDTVKTTMVMYEENGIVLPPTARKAYEEALALFVKIKPVCEENTEACVRLWDVFSIIETRMQGPMVAALYSSGSKDVIQKIESLFREGEELGPNMPGTPPPHGECDLIVGTDAAQKSMREWCKQRRNQEPNGYGTGYPPYGNNQPGVGGGHPDDVSGNRRFWTMNGESFRVDTVEQCDTLGEKNTWSTEEKKWCRMMFDDHHGSYEDAKREFWDKKGNRHEILSREDCATLAEQGAIEQSETDECYKVFDEGYSTPDERRHSPYFWDSKGNRYDVKTEKECTELATKNKWSEEEKGWCVMMFRPEMYMVSPPPQEKYASGSITGSSEHIYWSASKNKSFGIKTTADCDALVAKAAIPSAEKQWCYDALKDWGAGMGGTTSYRMYWSPSRQQSFNVPSRGDCDKLLSDGKIPRTEKEMCYTASDSRGSGGGGGMGSVSYWSPSKNKSFTVTTTVECDNLVTRKDIPSTEREMCYRSMGGGGGTGSRSYWSASKQRSFSVWNTKDCDALVPGSIPESERKMCYDALGNYPEGTGSSSYWYWSGTANKSFEIRSTADCDRLVTDKKIAASEKDMCNASMSTGGWNGWKNPECQTSKCYWSSYAQKEYPVSSEADCDALILKGYIQSSERDWCVMATKNWGTGSSSSYGSWSSYGTWSVWYRSPSRNQSFTITSRTDCDRMITENMIPATEKEMCYSVLVGGSTGSVSSYYSSYSSTSNSSRSYSSSSRSSASSSSGSGHEYWSTKGVRYWVNDEAHCDTLAGQNGWSENDRSWCKQMFTGYTGGTSYEYWTSTGEHYWVKQATDCDYMAIDHGWSDQDKQWCRSMFSGSSGGGETSTTTEGSYGGGSSGGSYTGGTTDGVYWYWSDYAKKSFEIRSMEDCETLISNKEIPESERDWCSASMSTGGWSGWSNPECQTSKCYWSSSAQKEYPVSSEADCDALISSGSIPSSERDWCVMATKDWGDSGSTSSWGSGDSWSSFDPSFWSPTAQKTFNVWTHDDCGYRGVPDADLQLCYDAVDAKY